MEVQDINLSGARRTYWTASRLEGRVVQLIFQIQVVQRLPDVARDLLGSAGLEVSSGTIAQISLPTADAMV